MAAAYKIELGTEADTSGDNVATEYNALEAYKIRLAETARKSSRAFEGTHYFVVGGKLVRLLAAVNAQQKEQGDHSLERDRVSWKWDGQVQEFRGMMDIIIDEVLPLIKEQQHPQVGILVILDTDMAESAELTDIHDALMWTKTQLDSYNLEEKTDHFIMVGLSHYYKDCRHRYSDSRVKSANAVFAAFNSHLNKRPTLDLNRYILAEELGRPLNIKGETHWKVYQKRFTDDGTELATDTLVYITQKVLEFLQDDNGMRCKEEELTYPFRRNHDGIIKFLPGYEVNTIIRDNVLDIQVEGADPEALYWMRASLLDEGLSPDQVPALPTLDLAQYVYKAWSRGQSAEAFPESKEERQIRKDRNRAKKEEKRERKDQQRQELWVEMMSKFLDVQSSEEEEEDDN